MPEVRRFSDPVKARALDLLALLEAGPLNAEEVCERTGWTRHQLDAALTCARADVCVPFGLTIPHPVPQDGWRFHLTGEWVATDGRPAIAAGTGYAVNHVEARLKSILRDVTVAHKNLDPQSIDGRKTNALRQHLGHLLSVLAEISGDERNHGEG